MQKTTLTRQNSGRAALETGKQQQWFTKRIGSTTYRVAVHFSKTSTENMNDKILRLIKSEAAYGKAAGE